MLRLKTLYAAQLMRSERRPADNEGMIGAARCASGLKDGSVPP